MKKKKKLDEGAVLLAPLLPVATYNNLKLSNYGPDNFKFKGLPGQFNENGEKVFDEFGEPINEFLDELVEVITDQIDRVIKRLQVAKKNGAKYVAIDKNQLLAQEKIAGEFKTLDIIIG